MTPGIRRLLTACLFALVAALPLAALSASVQAPTWPSGLPTQRLGQEGDAVSLEFSVTVPQGQTLSFSAANLPAGVQINPSTGVVSGTLRLSDAGTVNTGGAAGVHNVTLTALSSSGASSSYAFTWRISRFRSGDVFAGVGGGRYRVFSDQGVFKYEMTVDQSSDFVDYTGHDYGWGGGTTTGCGYNPVTRKMYFTAWDNDYDPSVAEVDPVPVGGQIVRTARISTFRDSGLEKGQPASGRPIDGSPESVAFGIDFGPDGILGTADDVKGAMYVGHAAGYYNLDETQATIDELPVIGTLDDWTTIFYTDPDETDTYNDYDSPLQSSSGPVLYPKGFSPEGYASRWVGDVIRDGSGNPLSPLVQWGRDIQKFVPNGSGGWTRAKPDADDLAEGYDAHAGWQGSDWLDLASDQRTMFYTSEWGDIYRYDVGPNPPGGVRQLPSDPGNRPADAPKVWPYASLQPRNMSNPSPVVLYALRLLPPGDGSGGLLVASAIAIYRINAAGTVVSSYDADSDGWFALNVAPDSRSFWSASTSNGRIYRWDIASGELVNLQVGGRSGFPSGAVNDGNGRFTLDGLCVMGEYTAAEEICGNVDSEGNLIDDDGDGQIDENCTPLEACSTLSPGDDDGDGLVDTNDPDCPNTVNVCAESGYTAGSIAGYCARKNFEGDNVSLSPAPGPTRLSGDYETYTVSGLPPGITAGANGVLSGTPLYETILNGATPNTQTYTVTYQVERRKISGNALVASYTQSFPWTIENVNRLPVAADFTAPNSRPGVPVTFTLSNQTGGGPAPCAIDADCEDTVTITGTTGLTAGTLASTGATYTWTPPTNVFTGLVTYTYTISDGRGGTDTGLVTINVVNRPPVAVLDAVVIRPDQTTVPVEVTANDTDADGDTLTVTFTPPAQGTITQSGPNGRVLTYTAPAAPFTGVVNVPYTVSDGYGGTASSTFRITIVNTAPVAGDDAATTRPATSIAIPVLTNDTDADAPPTPDAPDTITITGNTNPSNGTITRSGGTFTYTSAAGFAGTDSFTYTISDGFGGTDTATVTITVNNLAPVAVDDAVSTIAGYPTSSFNVLTLGTPDSDPDGDTFLITTVTNPSNGTWARTGNSFVYTPNNGFSGIDTFTYTIRDQYGLTDTATVTITVRNIPPIAVNDTATTEGTRPVIIPVMVNDSDPDGHVISVTGATTPANGTVVVNANGTITYTANAGFQGTDTFFYTIRDGFGGESTATVTITVGPPNRFDPCLCSSAKASPGTIWPPNHKETKVVTVTNVADPDGGPLTIKILGIYQDEPTNYLGDGSTTIDAGGVGTSQAWVRAERTGNPNVPGNGRVYEIVFEATAPDGSSCQGSVFTGVPHDQGQGAAIYDDGIRYDSTVAGGPIVRTALKVETDLTDAEVAERGFELKYVAEARIGSSTTGSSTSNREMIIGPTAGSTIDTEDFTWTSGQQALFLLWRNGSTVHFKLWTQNQFEYVSYDVDCGAGECEDIFIRAQAGGTGKITLSSMNLNGLSVADTLAIPVGGAARSIRLSGLSLGEGALLSGLVKIEWTGTRPTGNTVNFRVQVGAACAVDGGTGGGGGGTPPMARSDSYSTNEDTPLIVDAAAGVLVNDLTFGGPLTATLIDSTSNGSLSPNANGSFTYTPGTNFNGQDTFRYRVSDGTMTSEPALVTITVNPVVDPPVAVDDSATTDENTAVTIAVLTNDSDPFGATIDITAVTQPANGTAVESGTGIRYTPATGYTGTDSFTYTITGSEGTATATVTITVTNVNEPPVAVNNSYTTTEDTPLVVAAPGILANDSDPDAGDTFVSSVVTGPAHGTVTVNANGSFTYTPAANYSGADSYTYRVRDAGGLFSNTATVSITVTAANDPPVAVNDSYVVSEDGVLQINAPGVRSNDSDPDTAASGLSITLVTGAQRGSLTLNADGSFVYTPMPDVSGSDSFVYRISDGTGSATATATIAITDVADPPVAVNDTAQTTEDTGVTINVLGNDTDPDTTTLTLQSVTQPAHGSVTPVSGQARYTPAPNYNGQDTFTYTISDGTSTSTATVTVTISGANDAPVAVNDVYTTPQNTVLNIQTPGIVGNDSDPDGGQTLTARVITAPTSGTVVLQGHGAFAYTPANNFTGTATFTYRVNDGTADSNTATVTITVSASNRPPVVVNDSYSTDKNKTLTVAAPGVLGNDSDPDTGDTITTTLVSGTPASAGTVTLNANGSFTFVPANNYTGTTTFRYRARDQANQQSNAEAIVTIVVSAANTSGKVCYDGGSSQPHLRAQIDWETQSNGDIRARASVSRNYADNTYGVNKIGWGARKRDFKAVYNSDFGQLAFYDASGSKRIDFRIDLLSALSGTPSGYGSRGVSGGDGGMVSGSASNIVSMATSMDLNMNAFGYVSNSSSHPLKTNSPATNDSYTPNATYPSWIWDMWYEATVKGSTFGSAGFGTVTLRALHASPSKEDVTTWRLVNCQ